MNRIERVRQAKTPSQVREADLPSDEYEQFKELKLAVRSAVEKLPKSVVDALWHDLSNCSMRMPADREDEWEVGEQVKVGRLVVDEETGEVFPNADYPDVGSASLAISALAIFLDKTDRSEEFSVPMDLKQKGCWDALI